MSHENVEVVRRVWDAWARGDYAAAFELWDPEGEWDTTHYAGWPERSVYRGIGEVQSFLRDWLASWDDYEAGVEDILDAGDSVVVLCWQRGAGRGSGAVAQMNFAQIVALRDGRVLQVAVYSDRDEALEAAGLSE